MQIGCEAIADSHLVFVHPESTRRALSIVKEVRSLSSDGPEVQALTNVMKLITNSLSAAKVAVTEMAWEAGSDKPALLSGQCM